MKLEMQFEGRKRVREVEGERDELKWRYERSKLESEE